MCKFTKPTIPADATAEERRSIMFEAMKSLDLSDKCEKRENLTYLSWANAWAEFKSAYPSATYSIKKDANGLPYFADPNLGVIVFTEVFVDGISHEMWLPVLDGKNKPMKFQAYTYQVWDNYKKTYVDKTVNACTMFDVNRALMRCLTKNLSMFGLGLYIYAGDDLPEKSNDDQNSNNGQQTATPTPVAPVAPPAPVDPLAPIKNAINSMGDINSLMGLYLDHQNEVESNPEIKALFTQRRQQLQLLSGGRNNG